MGYLHVTYALTRKNVLLTIRDFTPLCITLSAAFLSMLIIYLRQLSIDAGDSFTPENLDTPSPTPYTLSTIPRCVPFHHPDCYTLAYVPAADLRVKRWVTAVARASAIPSSELIAFTTERQLNQFLFTNPNRTQAAYVFDSDSLAKIDDGHVQFIVQYNDTEQTQFPIGDTAFHAEVVLPTMIHQMNLVMMPELASRTVDVTLNASTFPHPPIVSLNSMSERGGEDAFGLHGPLMVFATFFLAAMMFLYKIVDENQRGLRNAMKLAGQYQSQHYLSWCIPFFAVNVLVTLLIIASGHIFRFKYFVGNYFSIYFLTLFIFSLSLIAWTCLIATIVRQSSSVSVVGFNLFIFSYIFATSGSLVYLFDEDGIAIVPERAIFLRQLFATLPSTMLVKALNDGNTLALKGIRIGLSETGSYSAVFPMRSCWAWMAASGAVAFVLSVYLDNVVGSESGMRLRLNYFVQPSYWGFRGVDETANGSGVGDVGDEKTEDCDDSEWSSVKSGDYDSNAEDADVRAEREAIQSGKRDSAVLVIKGLSKQFKRVEAVEDVWLSVERNSALAVVGHNGAGKSTLFKMLSTMLKPTRGDAFIDGLSVRRDPWAVRRVVGICAQTDVFWEDLTGAEHIELFATLKGVSGKEGRQEEVKRRLADVRLEKEGERRAGRYSGGMRRRLSVAIALTGDPKVVLLDECTSGADAMVRRDVWAALTRARRGRAVIVITHSMQEAEVLGVGGVAIMADGAVRVFGRASRLRRRFASGWRFRVESVDEAHAIAVVAAVKSCGATAERVGNDVKVRAKDEGGAARVARELEERATELGVGRVAARGGCLAEVFSVVVGGRGGGGREEGEEEEGGRRKRWRRRLRGGEVEEDGRGRKTGGGRGETEVEEVQEVEEEGGGGDEE